MPSNPPQNPFAEPQNPFAEPSARAHDRRSRRQAGAELAEELPALTIGEALSRGWRLILVLAIVGAVAGVAVGYAKPATYTSESQLNVGSLAAQAQAIPGYAAAAQTLAEAYARVVESAKVMVPVARSTHSSIGDVVNNLTSANIPGDPIFRIDGSGPTAPIAEARTAAATTAIIRYARVNIAPPGAVSSLEAFKRQTVLASLLSAKVGQLKAKYGPNPTPARARQIAAAQQAVAAANLKANAQQQNYINDITSATTAGSITVLSPASPATSNRTHAMEIGGFAGIVVGCLLACAIAIQLASRRRRQVMRALMLAD